MLSLLCPPTSSLRHATQAFNARRSNATHCRAPLPARLLRPPALDYLVRPLLDLLYALGDASRRVRLVRAAQAFAALRLRTRARRLELALVPLQLVLVQLAAANLVAVNVLRPILRHLSSSFSTGTTLDIARAASVYSFSLKPP